MAFTHEVYTCLSKTEPQDGGQRIGSNSSEASGGTTNAIWGEFSSSRTPLFYPMFNMLCCEIQGQNTAQMQQQQQQQQEAMKRFVSTY